MSRLQQAFERFDAANADDPRSESVDGVAQPKELVYAQRMTERLDRFAPDASVPLRLAARCQHIRRWIIPRMDYPSGRAGYRQWRTELSGYHAQTAAGILRDVGYNEATVARVETLLRKEGLKTDPEVQSLEDVVCLVFLEHYLGDFASEHEDAKLVDILRKTWRKMSNRGRAEALMIDLPPDLRALVGKATKGGPYTSPAT